MTITTVWAAEGSRDLAWPQRLKVKGRRDQSVSQSGSQAGCFVSSCGEL